MKEIITQSWKEKDVLSCETLEDAECNREKEDADEARKVAELKEDADARKVEEERQKKLEEARKAAELKGKEEKERKARCRSLGKAGTFRGRGSNKRSR